MTGQRDVKRLQGAPRWLARGSGTPRGNQNALKHGLYSREHLGWRQEMNALLREVNDTLDEL